MSLLDKFLGTSLALVALYLFLANYQAASQILATLGTVTNTTFATLQGR